MVSTLTLFTDNFGIVETVMTTGSTSKQEKSDIIRRLHALVEEQSARQQN